DHRPHPPAAALAPDLPGAELRDLLVLPAQARLRPARGADPVPPLEPAVRGDDLLRLRQLRVAQGRRGRIDHAPSLGAATRAAARARREGDRAARDTRARRDVRHVPPAEAVDVLPRPRRRSLRVLVVRERAERRRADRGLRRLGRGPHLPPVEPSVVAFLAAPEPFSFELTTARFRICGPDKATLWEDRAVYRAVGGGELRIAPAEGGVDAEPLDAETEPVVRKLLGFDFDLGAFSAWAASEEALAPL